MILALQGVNLVKASHVKPAFKFSDQKELKGINQNKEVEVGGKWLQWQGIKHLFIELGLNVSRLHLQLLQRFDPAPHRRWQRRNIPTRLQART